MMGTRVGRAVARSWRRDVKSETPQMWLLFAAMCVLIVCLPLLALVSGS